MTKDPISSKELLLVIDAPLVRVERSVGAGTAKLSREGAALCDRPCCGVVVLLLVVGGEAVGVAMTVEAETPLVRVERSVDVGSAKLSREGKALCDRFCCEEAVGGGVE